MDELNAETVLNQPVATASTPNDIPIDDVYSGLEEAINKDKEASSKEQDKQESAPADDKEKPEDATQEASEPKLDLTPKKEEAPHEELTKELGDDVKAPHTSADWKRYKEARNAVVRQNKELQAKVAEMESRSTDLAQLEDLKQKVSVYEQQAKEAKVFNDPELTREVDSRLSIVIENAKAGLDEGTAKDLEAVMVLPPGKHREKIVSNMVEDMSPLQQSRIGTFLARADELRSERSIILNNAKQNADSYLASRKAADEQRKQAIWSQQTAVFDATISEFKGMPGWKEVMANTDYVKPIIESAKNTFVGNVGTPKDLAMKAVQAEFAPKILEVAIATLQESQKKDAQIEQLSAELKRFKSGSASPDHQSETVTSNGKDDDIVSGAMRILGG